MLLYTMSILSEKGLEKVLEKCSKLILKKNKNALESENRSS